MTKVKFCGLKNLDDVAICNEVKPDYVGFILAKSKRRIDQETAQKLRQALDPSLPCVGVFVNEEPEIIRDYVEAGIIQVIQLHGDEDRAYIKKLRELCQAPIIKALAIKDQASFQVDLPCDAYLYDAYNKQVRGGSGQSFNWDLISSRPAKHRTKPFFLAGGLKASNLDEAIRTTQADGVDISSGIEGADGHKDYNKAKEICQIVRSAQ
ncbi:MULTISPECIES: phosphoribosylanthranilate isomerase [Aerococcus]|uniref:N-(5'-phosphoribosyl)anthranilate isomerase n=1 Tax=Aerococcus sanguinicola TaxID=119206 RepID=A0A5N1GFR8_9LACT|nr:MULTISPECIES: phosphoribosylanthranilate isomerase [Aerococcus]KAA9299622.1 phosphoribosylanthranilate isomerase [Aerococcus sanguinicola]MDK6369989.1 phosphoribosylanthranilate isomerase [Aerococcus sp. UMB9870]MDK6680537.1 phosphoribosylanthranilate isomerase [Aerococcus sp. UMB8608]MDK6687367.1 phosphoribosylanthranilate isomerase [Aerococcus sp. UMB8623]MDK6940512.1 phosphoribosylanthranilate isomerase [Aerococcus sp. UMB8487]